jgi:hypothetical protein
MPHPLPHALMFFTVAMAAPYARARMSFSMYSGDRSRNFYVFWTLLYDLYQSFWLVLGEQIYLFSLREPTCVLRVSWGIAEPHT